MKFTPFLALAPLAAAGVVRRNNGPQAIYFLDNEPTGAGIVSLKVGANGIVSGPVRTSTGGNGMFGEGANNTVPGADQLFSQDSVVVSGNYLFTVNPGSDTVAFFSIPENDPSRPQLIGKPVSSGGQYPSSVAYSPELRLACVVNGGAKAGVMCYDVQPPGLRPKGEFMPLDLNQSTPPLGPPNTASDIVFNPSSTGLFVTVKGDGTNPGFIYGYPIVDGKVSPKARVSSPADLLLDFSVSFIDDTHAVISDPSYGASLVDICYPCLTVDVVKKVTVAGEGAVCWSRYAARFDAVYLFDAGKPVVTVLDPTTADVKYTLDAPAATEGSFDSVVAGEYLYVLEAAAGVGVWNLAGKPSFVQSINLTSAGVGKRQAWQGMAAWPADL